MSLFRIFDRNHSAETTENMVSPVTGYTTEREKIPFTLERRRRKTIGITIDQQGSVSVRYPYWVSKEAAIAYANEKEEWISRTLQKIEERRELSASYNWEEKKLQTYPWIRGKGGELFRSKVAAWAAVMGVTYQKITVKDISSRWGSCSTRGNLNFSWKLFVLPEALVDYVVVHELAHLIHMNHSAQFWDVVAQYLPDYRERKKELNNYI